MYLTADFKLHSIRDRVQRTIKPTLPFLIDFAVWATETRKNKPAEGKKGKNLNERNRNLTVNGFSSVNKFNGIELNPNIPYSFLFIENSFSIRTHNKQHTQITPEIFIGCG